MNIRTLTLCVLAQLMARDTYGNDTGKWILADPDGHIMGHLATGAVKIRVSCDPIVWITFADGEECNIPVHARGTHNDTAREIATAIRTVLWVKLESKVYA